MRERRLPDADARGRPVTMPPAAERGEEIARAQLLESAAVTRRTAELQAPAIEAMARLIADAFRQGGKLLLCGNGGSAADCQHMASELVSRLRRDVDRPALPAIALTTDTSFLTAFVNDVGFDGVFARQVQALGQPGDVLLAISTSGTSANVLRAVETAHARGLKTVALTGKDGLAVAADLVIAVASGDTQHVQESHLAIEHVVCDLVERRLFPSPARAGVEP